MRNEHHDGRIGTLRTLRHCVKRFILLGCLRPVGYKARAKPEFRISHGLFGASAPIAQRDPAKVTRIPTRGVGPSWVARGNWEPHKGFGTQLGDPGCGGGIPSVESSEFIKAS